MMVQYCIMGTLYKKIFIYLYFFMSFILVNLFVFTVGLDFGTKSAQFNYTLKRFPCLPQCGIYDREENSRPPFCPQTCHSYIFQM